MNSGTDVHRSVYIGTPLCVQVVAPKLEERRLCEVMGAIDEAVHGGKGDGRTIAAKL